MQWPSALLLAMPPAIKPDGVEAGRVGSRKNSHHINGECAVSNWTDVFLACTSLEDCSSSDEPECYPAVQKIDKWLEAHSYGKLFRVQPNNDWQQVPTGCFFGHFKNLGWDGFIEAVRQAPWEWKEQVQLFLRQEDDLGFQEIELFPKTETKGS